MEIEDFVALVDRQHEFICDAADLDNAYLTCPPSEWPRRGLARGWTKADLRRYAQYMEDDPDPLPLPSSHGPANFRMRRAPSTRVSTALRVFDFASPIAEASRRAIDECGEYAELSDVPPLILRLFATHREWLEWMLSGMPSDVDSRWIAARHDLWWVVQNHGLLRPDLKAEEWNRWRSLCTTAKRRGLLDFFWLAKSPVSRADIAPDSGTGFRRIVGEVNKLAATAKPPIPWEIRADEKTQKWSKNWLGR